MSSTDTFIPGASVGAAPSPDVADLATPNRTIPWVRLRAIALAVSFPILLVAAWHFATNGRPGTLIPPPAEVWLALRDLAVGGINDDAFSATLHLHVLASISRVFGGFGLALLVALPLGLLIGRIASCATFSIRRCNCCGRSPSRRGCRSR